MVIGPEKMIEPNLVKCCGYGFKRYPRAIRKPDSRNDFHFRIREISGMRLSKNLPLYVPTLIHLYPTLPILLVMIDFMHINDCSS